MPASLSDQANALARELLNELLDSKSKDKTAQKRVGELLDISQPRISSISRGKSGTTATVLLIAAALRGRTRDALLALGVAPSELPVERSRELELEKENQRLQERIDEQAHLIALLKAQMPSAALATLRTNERHASPPRRLKDVIDTREALGEPDGRVPKPVSSVHKSKRETK